MTMTAAGVAKLIEEVGELQTELGQLQQILGKKLAYWHTDEHPDGVGPISGRIQDEMADVKAAIYFVTVQLGLDQKMINDRAREKVALFDTWHEADRQQRPSHRPRHIPTSSPRGHAMKALTLWQPWASLIAVGLKTIETRSRAAPRSLIGQRIAIHAAKRYPEPFDNDLIGDFKITEDIPLGAVVATALLIDCVPIEVVLPAADRAPGTPAYSTGHDKITLHPLTREAHLFRGNNGTIVTDQLPYGNFAPGRFAWIFTDVNPMVPPISAIGHQGIWEWTP